MQMTFLNNVREVGRLVLSRTSCSLWHGGDFPGWSGEQAFTRCRWLLTYTGFTIRWDDDIRSKMYVPKIRYGLCSAGSDESLMANSCEKAMKSRIP
jgi:hypothetical protein